MRLAKLERQLAEATATVESFYRWQSEINELMPEGLGERVTALLGEQKVHEILVIAEKLT